MVSTNPKSPLPNPEKIVTFRWLENGEVVAEADMTFKTALLLLPRIDITKPQGNDFEK